MRFVKILKFILGLGFSASLVAAPEVGDVAPDFSLQGSDGKTYSIAQFSEG